MDTKPLVLLADKGLSNQALLGDLLSSEAQVSSIVRERQLKFWLHDVETMPSLLILDYAFFQQQTAEFCQTWLSHPEMRNVPIIIAGPGDDDIELLALTCGAIDFLAKPYNKPVLTLARLKLHLAQIKETRRLSSLSMTDSLTQIANRRYFNESYSAEWRRACREQGSIGLIMMDIDHFKAFNDHYGHLQGDECLTSVAQQLKAVIKRPRDFVARFGGEEFIVLLPSVQAQGVAIVAERLQETIHNLMIPHAHSSTGSHVSVSMGLAWCEPSSDLKPEQLIAAADEALYSAKDTGRNRYSDVVTVDCQLMFQTL